MRDPDRRSLLLEYAVSAAGSGLGSGALPIVAVLVLHASAFEVSMLSGLASLTAAAVLLPLGAGIEHRRKRPAMIAADLARCAALASVPAAAALHLLTYPQLVAVGAISTTASIVFAAASGAHLKAITDPADRLRTNSWFETADWMSGTAGPPVGGLLIGGIGATATMAIDAASYLGSAVGVRRIHASEPPPPERSASSGIRPGWRHIMTHPGLRPLFFNAMLFGGPVVMTFPLLAVLILDELHLSASAYGLALGVPCLGGIAGSRLAPVLVHRFGQRRVLLAAGVARAPWLLLYPLAPHGLTGLMIIMVADTAILTCVGVFNPVFATYRMEVTADAYMTRVRTAWGISSQTVQPLFVLAGGGLAALTSVRTALLIAGLACLASVALLPYRTLSRDAAAADAIHQQGRQARHGHRRSAPWARS
ncbi:MFS transporter [Parafrankia colletiae]|uniref:MFS transporter n=1 Tax=Parafrankia colletiae TaxID=573497 RepID=A0A1S1RGC1_9ACTN|nr:MFS transporter [Parafrankia colletiae]MCK9904982.1 MFS transporter [Frankia sp. Cpl3]OHV44302.1 MFS transporter [Parafrankia colletiae]